MKEWAGVEIAGKIIGRIANSDKGLILLFDLEEAICFEPTKKEVVNPVTGKKTVVNNKIYPKKYEGKIGMDYNDYVSGDMNSKFENLGEYIEDSQVGDSSEEPIVAGTTNELFANEILAKFEKDKTVVVLC